ncbi:MAG: hypothetical protein AB7F59_08940 [Bdellovibrionales bacterium]
MRSWMVSCLLLFVATVSNATILPENNLHLQDNVDAAANMTEQQFSDIIDAVTTHWAPMAAKHGATLVVNKLWTNSTVNASAQQSGNQWIINMYGGLARRPETNFEGFALVVCHELGHHFAGYSFYSGTHWAASEGQSDYFATQACGKMIWDAPIFGTLNPSTLNPHAKAKCDSTYTSAVDRKNCYRNILGGHSLASLLAALGRAPAPKFETPDPTVVTRTNTAHPAAQCRLDTYFQGALCNARFDATLIPGKAHPRGQTSADAEMVANEYSCNLAKRNTIGNRPSCWYKGIVQ